MFVLNRANKPTIFLKREPEMYGIKIFRLNESSGNVIIWESFSNEIARAFNLHEKLTYSILKKVAVHGSSVQFGEYTKDIALTRISSAIYICGKYKTAIKLDFDLIKLQ